MKKLVMGLMAMVVLATGTIWAQDNGPVLEPERVMTQGEFAVLMARAITSKEPEQGYTAEEAITFLNELGIMPEGGWTANADLNEGAMVHIIRYVGVHISTLDPELLVTVAKANLVFKRYERRFRTYMLYKMNADNWTDSTILDEGDVTGLLPLSPK